MQLKRFIAFDMTKVLGKVKQALGDEAVILSNHRVETGIEVVGAIDYDDSVIKSHLSSKVESSLKQINFSQSSLANDNPSDYGVRYLREIIKNQLSDFAWQNNSYYKSMEMLLIKQLIALGFDINICEKFVKDTVETNNCQKAWFSLLTHMLKEVPFQIFIDYRSGFRCNVKLYEGNLL